MTTGVAVADPGAVGENDVVRHTFAEGTVLNQAEVIRVGRHRPVTKTMTIDMFREKIADAEDMDLYSFEPGTGHAELVAERSEDGEKRRLLFRMSTPEGPREFGVGRDAYLHLATMVGVPSGYIEKVPTDLMLPHMNWFLEHGKNIPIIGLGAMNDKVAVFSRGMLNPVSNFHVVDAVEELLGKELQVQHVSTDLWNTSFSIIRQGLEVPVRVGDTFRTGVSFQNSYAMARPLEISTYIERLICANGAISVDNVFKFSRRGFGDGMDEWIKQSLRAAVDAADMEVGRLRELADMRLGDHFTDALNSIFTEFAVPQTVRDLIREQIIQRAATEEGKIETMYDLYNAITDVASNNEAVLADGQLARKLMRVGSRIAAHPALCGECHRVMA